MRPLFFFFFFLASPSIRYFCSSQCMIDGESSCRYFSPCPILFPFISSYDPGGMSEQNGVSGRPSIENPPQSSTTTTTPASINSTSTLQHPSDSQVLQGTSSSSSSSQVTIDSTAKSQSTSNSSSSSTTTSSGRPRIPKLSAATTELLARVNGYLKGGHNNYDNKNNGVAGLNLYGPLNSTSTDLDKMRASSAIIELPTAPFDDATAAGTPPLPSISVTNKAPPKPSQNNGSKPSTGLVAIAPKPAAVQTNGPQAQRPIQSQPIASVATAATAPATGTGTASSTDSIKPQKAATASRKRKSTSNNTKRSRKRRRGDDSDGEGVIRAGDSSSDESDVAPTATQTKSGRQVHRPSLYVPPASSPVTTSKGNTDSVDTADGEAAKTTTNSTTATSASSRKRKRVYRKGKDANANCCHCQRGHSPSTNMIVFCDECNNAWHQLCHDPPISDEVVTIKEKEWFCRECKPVPYRITQPTVVRSSPRKRRSHPLVQSPPVIPQLEVGGEKFSSEERLGYLSSLSHATLVQLLVTLSDRHPSLEMFPANLKSLRLSKFPFQPAAQSAHPSSDPTTTTTNPTGEKADKENSDPGPSSSTRKNRDDFVPSDESESEQFQEHRLYPRAGNGFRLSVNVDDLDILREDPSCPTFSYALHGPAKSRAEANEAVPVWGAA